MFQDCFSVKCRRYCRVSSTSSFHLFVTELYLERNLFFCCFLWIISLWKCLCTLVTKCFGQNQLHWAHWEKKQCCLRENVGITDREAEVSVNQSIKMATAGFILTINSILTKTKTRIPLSFSSIKKETATQGSCFWRWASRACIYPAHKNWDSIAAFSFSYPRFTFEEKAVLLKTYEKPAINGSHMKYGLFRWYSKTDGG